MEDRHIKCYLDFNPYLGLKWILTETRFMIRLTKGLG